MNRFARAIAAQGVLSPVLVARALQDSVQEAAEEGGLDNLAGDESLVLLLHRMMEIIYPNFALPPWEVGELIKMAEKKSVDLERIANELRRGT